MKFSVAALLTAITTTVYAQTVANAGIAVNLPSLGQVLTAGTTFTITWTVDANATNNPSTTINSIALMNGASSSLQYYITNILSAPIPVNPPSYSWNIPATVETNPSYVLAVAGSNGATTYSTYFTIMGAAPGNSTAPAAASSAAAVPSASGTAAAAANNSTKSGATASPTNAASSANSLKAGVIGAAGVAGAIALLI